MSGPDFFFFLSSRSISKHPLDSPHMGIAQVFQTQNQCDWIKSISLPNPVLTQCTTTYGKEQGIFLESFLPQIPHLPRSTPLSWVYYQNTFWILPLSTLLPVFGSVWNYFVFPELLQETSNRCSSSQARTAVSTRSQNANTSLLP